MTVPEQTSHFTTRPLYGGAITALLPTSFLDASDVRPVPDHQEVFTSPSAAEPLSIIFDILEAQPGTNEEVIATHFRDVAEGAYEFLGEVAVAKVLPEEKEVVIVKGKTAQVGSRVGQFVVIMGVVRLENVNTDFVVTVNVPMGGDDAQNVKDGELIFENALKELKVVNWGLFGA